MLGYLVIYHELSVLEIYYDRYTYKIYPNRYHHDYEQFAYLVPPELSEVVFQIFSQLSNNKLANYSYKCNPAQQKQVDLLLNLFKRILKSYEI